MFFVCCFLKVLMVLPAGAFLPIFPEVQSETEDEKPDEGDDLCRPGRQQRTRNYCSFADLSY